MSTHPPDEPPFDRPGGSGADYPPTNRTPGPSDPSPGGYTPPGQQYPGQQYPPPGGYVPPGQQYPPPGGGWSAPGSGGYGGYGHSGGRLDIGQAVSYGWRKFTQNAGPLILCTLIVFIVQFGAGLLTLAFDSAGAQFVIRILGTIVALVMTRGLIRAGLSTVNGNRVEAAQVFRFDRIGGFLVGSIILGLLQGLLAVLPLVILGAVLGSIVAIVAVAVANALFGFYGFAIVERDLDGVSGLRRSFELTKPRLGVVFLFWLVMGLISILGFLACGVGLLVAIPVSYVAQAHAYRQLSGEPVAP